MINLKGTKQEIVNALREAANELEGINDDETKSWIRWDYEDQRSKVLYALTLIDAIHLHQGYRTKYTA